MGHSLLVLYWITVLSDILSAELNVIFLSVLLPQVVIQITIKHIVDAPCGIISHTMQSLRIFFLLECRQLMVQQILLILLMQQIQPVCCHVTF